MADPALAVRIKASLAQGESIELVDVDDAPDAMIIGVGVLARHVEPEVALTGRELEVLALLAEGASNKLIARRLGISVHTAKFHVASLLEKLDAVSRTDLVAQAARRGVISL